MIDQDQNQKQALKFAYRLLSYRPRSREELKNKLLKKGFTLQVITWIINTLESEGLIDDVAFTRFWIENRLQFNPRGRQLLWHELKKKGINEITITNELSKMLPESQEYKVAEYLALKWINKHQQILRKINYEKKICDLLARRGFNSEIIQETIKLLQDKLEINSYRELECR